MKVQSDGIAVPLPQHLRHRHKTGVVELVGSNSLVLAVPKEASKAFPLVSGIADEKSPPSPTRRLAPISFCNQEHEILSRIPLF